MKNKKGFTLVELLAVIAILAVIMLLIVPNIVKMFQNGRKDAFIRQVQSVWKEAEKNYAAYLTYGEEYVVFCDKTKSEYGCSELSINESDIEYYVTVNESGHATEISVSDGNYCFSEILPSINIDREDLTAGTMSCDIDNESKVCGCLPKEKNPQVTNKPKEEPNE